jgi:T5SS/PEP-CTERM-associated repeat protein
VANSLANSETTVKAGGSLLVHGLFTDHVDVECADIGSSIDAEGGMTDVGLVVGPGGQVTAANISNLLGSSCTFQGAGALVSVTRDFMLAEGATLDLSSGATLQVGNNLILDGGTNFVNGGGGWSDSQTSVQVSGEFTVGDTAGNFSLAVKNAAHLQSNASYIGGGAKGSLALSDTGTVWEVRSGGLVVGSESTGNLNISLGANLLVDSGAFGVGFLSASSGTVLVDGPGSLIDARGSEVSIGKESGSQGSLQVQNQANLVVDQAFFVGDGGVGSLSFYTGGQGTVQGRGTTFGIGHLPGANGTVFVESGSSLTVEGTNTVGDAGFGRLEVFGGSTLRTAGTIVGRTNGGSGEVRIANTNSTWLEPNKLILGSALASTGSVIIVLQAQLQVTTNCMVGDSGQGSLWVYGGGTATFGASSDNNFGAGNAAGSRGLVTVGDPDSSLNFIASSIVGVSGTGSVLVTNGATVQSGLFELGAVPGSSGSIFISGSGSAWSNRDDFFVGGENRYQPAGLGSVQLTNGATFRAATQLYISPSGTVTLDGSSQAAVGGGNFGPPGTLRITRGGKLFGRGKVLGQLIVGLGGVFAPGDSPGIFTIHGDYQQEAGGELDIVIGGNDPGSGFAQVVVSGTATLGGILNVYLINGFVPVAGQTFAFLNALTASGQFAQVNGASITYGPTGAILGNVTGATPPSSPQLSIQRNPQSALVSWPATAQGFTLQTSGDPASDNWTDITTSSNSLSISFTNPASFFRLVHY